MVLCIYCGVTGYNLKKNIFLSLKIHFVLVNGADPLATFHLGSSVCQNENPDGTSLVSALFAKNKL